MTEADSALASVPSPAQSGDPAWGRRQLWGLAACFFLLFLGAGAFQQFLKPALGGTEQAGLLRTRLLAVVYGSFLVWRIGVAWTARWLGEWLSIFLGALCYALLPTLILLGAPGWLLLVGGAVWGWGAASLWVASGSRVLHLADRSQYGRGAATIYVGTLTGLALGLVVQSLLSWYWGSPWATVPWAAGVALAGAAVAATLWRGGAPQEAPKPRVYASLLLDRRILLAGVMLFASGLTYSVLLSTFSDEVIERTSVVSLGLVALWFHVPKAVLSYAGGWANDRWGRRVTLSVGFLGGAVGLVLASFLRWSVGLGAAAFFLGLPSGMVPVVATAMAGDLVKGPRRMMALGSLFIWRDAAMVVGLLGGELLRQRMRLEGSYLVLAAVLVGFAVASRWLYSPGGGGGSDGEGV